MIPLHHELHFTLRFGDDRIIPRFHLDEVEPGRRISVFKLENETGERLEQLTTATVGKGGWDVSELLHAIAVYDWKYREVLCLDGCSHSFTAGEVMSDARRQMNPDSTLLKLFEAESWNDAMRQYHEFKGWEPYKPMLEENGNEYPEDNLPIDRSATQS